ncbi:MAG: FAD:protein FMN transferase, partial [Oscillospiraceae bacterium]|nr:FAD:protein FMN transferase [Oscillospiraceae bacterium]
MRKFFLTVFISAAVIFSSCAFGDSPAEKTVFAMDTYMKLTAYGNNADYAVSASEEKISELEKLWSVTDVNSEIYAVNHSGGAPVPLSRETAELLSLSLEMSEATGGALDCTMYPVLKEWGFTTGEYKIPESEKIAELLKNTGYENIDFNGVYVVQPIIALPENFQIDLGAVGKGFTGDIVSRIMRENGVTSALLDLGGNIQTVGNKPDGTPWKIGLRNPFGDGLFGVLELSDKAAVTSGGYERYFVGEDGETYWHILDPSTGKPAQSGIISATAVGESGGICDALSTSLFVMGAEKSEEFWKQQGGKLGFEMVLV